MTIHTPYTDKKWGNKGQGKHKKESRNFFRRATTNYHWQIGGDFRSCRGESATNEQLKKKFLLTASS